MKNTLIMVLCLILISLYTVGCTKELTNEALQSEEVQAKLIEANSNLDSYSMDLKMDADMKMESDSLIKTTEQGMNMKMDLSGSIDMQNRKMELKGTMGMDMLGMKMEMDMEMFIVDGYQYTKMPMGEILGGMWMKEELNDDIWNQQDQIKKTIELIKSGTIEMLDDQVIDGKQFYVVKINPDLKVAAQLALEEQGKSELYNEKMDFEDMIKDYKATVWVNKNTFIIEKEIIEIKMVMTSENMGDEDSYIKQMGLDMALDVTMSNFNEPVTIQLPEEAKDAIDVGDLTSLGDYDSNYDYSDEELNSLFED